MKKIVVLFLFTIPVLTGFSQAKLVNAIKYLDDYTKSKDQESLTKAKENIDVYMQTPEIKDPAKALKVKGLVYLAIFDNNLGLQMNKLTIADPNQKALTAYQNTTSDELDVAVKAFAEAKTADKKGFQLAEILPAEKRIYEHYYNKGIANSNANKLPEAIEMYEKAIAVDESTDSTLLLSLASNAFDNKNYDKAKASLTKMIDANKGSALVYNLLIQSDFNLKDTASAMEMLKKGRLAYPSDEALQRTETDFFLKSGKSEEAIKNLNAVIASKPQEPGLYLARGNMFDNLAHPEDAKNNKLPKPANYGELMKSAEADYKKVIELCEPKYKNLAALPAKEAEQIKDTYSQALYYLGIVYFNVGVDISASADKITDNAKFAAQNKKANDEFMKAMPYFEKSQEMKSDQQKLYALKQIYARLEMMDKLKAVNEKMKN